METILSRIIKEKNSEAYEFACEIIPEFICSCYPSFQETSVDWNKAEIEFNKFLFEKEIKPYKFNRALKSALPSLKDRKTFTEFLISYWLISEGKATYSIVENIYQTIVDRAMMLEDAEKQKIDPDLKALNENPYPYIGGRLYKLLWVIECSVAGSNILIYLKSREWTIKTKAVAVLGAPYCMNVTASPDEWLAYFFGFKPKCTAIFPILHRVMLATFNNICSVAQTTENELA